LPENRKNPGKRGSVILYYPENGESSFEIAKKYGVPAASVSERDQEEDAPILIYCK
jgi:hypothetical protein